MEARIGKFFEALAASLWFVPTLMALAAIGAALGLVELDRRVEPKALGTADLFFRGGPEGARAVLSAVASSMMTVTGVTFSITIVALTLASQQYTPRLLRHFTADRGNQVVLGTFLATFIYSLLVLRTIRGDSGEEFVPNIAVTAGVAMALVSMAVLIYFIHHVAASIQPSTILSRIADETLGLLDHLFPEPLGAEAELEAARAVGVPERVEGGRVAPARGRGYLQAVDQDALMRLAREEDLLLRLERRVGDAIQEDRVLATVWPGARVTPSLVERLNRCFAFGRDRTLQQDPEYGVIQIADIAVKALSPGINDPTTAMTCLDALGSLLRRLAGRQIPSPYRRDETGKIRVVAPGPDFHRMVALAFRQVRHYGEGDAAVTIHLVETIVAIAAVLPAGSDRHAVLRDFLTEVMEGATRALPAGAERARALRAIRQARFALDVPSPPAEDSASIPGAHSSPRK